MKMDKFYLFVFLSFSNFAFPAYALGDVREESRLDEITTESVEDATEDTVTTNSTFADIEVDPQLLYNFFVVTEAAKLLPYKIGTALQLYYMPVMSFCGIVGNILSGVVMMQPANRELSSSNYILGLAGSDTVCLVAAFYHWVMSDGPVLYFQRRLDENRLECKVVGYISACAQLTSVFIVCAMTFDRLVAIREPLKARHICTLKRARLIILILALTAFVIRLPYLWHTEPLGKRDCVAYLVKAPWITGMYWFNVTISYYIPFIFLLAANCVIINTIKNRRKYFKGEGREDTIDQQSKSTQFVEFSAEDGTGDFEPNPDQNSAATSMSDVSALPSMAKKTAKITKGAFKKAASRQEVQITVMLLTVTFAFLLLLLPIYVAHIVYMFRSVLESPQAYADYILAAGVGIKLVYTNNAINFYLYCLSGSKFRSDLKKVLFCWRKG